MLTGTIAYAPDTPPAHEHPGYVAKYAAWMTQVFGSLERFSSMFSAPLFFHATNVRGESVSA